MSGRLGTRDASPRREDWRRELLSVPAPRTVPDEAGRPRPRWSQEVGAAVLLSVIETLRDEDRTTSA